MSGKAPLRVAMIGYGAIGQEVARLAADDADMQIVAALVRDPTKARMIAGPQLVTTLDALLAAMPEVVVEAGGHAALTTHGPGVLRAGCDLIMVSVGAFAVPGVLEGMHAAARAGDSQAKIASGAIGALDAIAAAAVSGLDRVTHTTRKPARTLLPPDEVATLTEARELFRGPAREAALRFPESINVAAAVSLAGIGLDRTEVVMIADPAVTHNIHIVTAEGAFGTLRFEIANVPSETNARTGKLVAMSIFHALRTRTATLIAG